MDHVRGHLFDGNEAGFESLERCQEGRKEGWVEFVTKCSQVRCGENQHLGLRSLSERWGPEVHALFCNPLDRCLAQLLSTAPAPIIAKTEASICDGRRAMCVLIRNSLFQ